MTHEFAFLLASVRRFFQPGTALPCPDGIDWPRLTQLAERHAVIGLLYQALQQEAVRQPPAPALDALRLRAWETMRQDLILSAELAKLLDIFAEERIAVISLKGPALREILYGHKGLRSSTDLDLLVHAPDAPRARRLLESRGYRLESALHWSSENALFRCRDSEISFAGPVRVDLHWRLLPGYFPGSFDESQVWNNPRVVPFAGTEAWTLAPERLLLFLCAHGTKHIWERLGWICDVARLLQVEPDMDWSGLFIQAAQTDTSRMVLLGLILASELFGVELPAAAADRARQDPRPGTLAGKLKVRLQEEHPRPQGRWSPRYSACARSSGRGIPRVSCSESSLNPRKPSIGRCHCLQDSIGSIIYSGQRA